MKYLKLFEQMDWVEDWEEDEQTEKLINFSVFGSNKLKNKFIEIGGFNVKSTKSIL